MKVDSRTGGFYIIIRPHICDRGYKYACEVLREVVWEVEGVYSIYELLNPTETRIARKMLEESFGSG